MAGPWSKIVLTVPYVAVGHILKESDLEATDPGQLAQALTAPFGLSYVRHPAGLSEIAINFFWYARNNKDPANASLRSLIDGLLDESAHS